MFSNPELLAVCIASMVGSALAVWGVVRHELRGMRDEIERAHSRIDTWPASVRAALRMNP